MRVSPLTSLSALALTTSPMVLQTPPDLDRAIARIDHGLQKRQPQPIYVDLCREFYFEDCYRFEFWSFAGIGPGGGCQNLPSDLFNGPQGLSSIQFIDNVDYCHVYRTKLCQDIANPLLIEHDTPDMRITEGWGDWDNVGVMSPEGSVVLMKCAGIFRVRNKTRPIAGVGQICSRAVLFRDVQSTEVLKGSADRQLKAFGHLPFHLVSFKTNDSLVE
ncbi:hypothetical protein EJ08DRAFT_681334 [Tothia fuscella]|uniref:Uncharacterized protein n=1 Tax=Tothia fuscella TaxID=1048955 RepID=A0A9P4NKW4_9PEZI|nr:hypothetical protein EJ08DRAFT_681334 [Tothia fuscella]